MLEKIFHPPEKEVAVRETARRKELIRKFLPEIQPAITGFMLSGSMAYGEDYSVTEKSDMDMQLTVNLESTEKLRGLGIFPEKDLETAFDAYRRGLVQQFSVVFEREGVSHECHFWDESAYIKAVTLVTAVTPRLRSSLSPSSDYGYSLEGQEHKQDYTGSEIDGFFVSDFPSYRDIDGVRYFCRPVTNVLGCMKTVYANDRLREALDETWRKMAGELKHLGLSAANVLNCLPGKNKVSPENKEWITRRMERELGV